MKGWMKADEYLSKKRGRIHKVSVYGDQGEGFDWHLFLLFGCNGAQRCVEVRGVRGARPPRERRWWNDCPEDTGESLLSHSLSPFLSPPPPPTCCLSGLREHREHGSCSCQPHTHTHTALWPYHLGVVTPRPRSIRSAVSVRMRDHVHPHDWMTCRLAALCSPRERRLTATWHREEHHIAPHRASPACQ